MSDCIFVYACTPRPSTAPNKEQLTVKFSVEIGALPENNVAKTSPKIHKSSCESFQLPRNADDGLLRRLISTSIASLDIPFRVHSREKSLLWGTLTFPEEGKAAFENLDEIKSRLCGVARRCRDTDHMYVVIRKVEKVSDEDYKKLVGPGNSSEGLRPFSGWIKENEKDVHVNRIVALLQTLSMHSKKGWRVEEKQGEHEECSVCLQDLNTGSEALRMPCSHMFHRLCIFKWIRLHSTCPICRSNLKIDSTSA